MTGVRTSRQPDKSQLQQRPIRHCRRYGSQLSETAFRMILQAGANMPHDQSDTTLSFTAHKYASTLQLVPHCKTAQQILESHLQRLPGGAHSAHSGPRPTKCSPSEGAAVHAPTWLDWSHSSCQ
eukprot:5321781-Pyramimonas_sp.AAC.1